MKRKLVGLGALAIGMLLAGSISASAAKPAAKSASAKPAAAAAKTKTAILTIQGMH